MTAGAADFFTSLPYFNRILVVEDEALNREILSATLEDAGYVIVCAEDGQLALDILRKDPDFGLVIADRRMPNMDGMALYAAMKKDPGLRSIPLLMQTGASLPHEIVEGIRAGVYYYLTKPYEPEALLALVKSALRERQQQSGFLQDQRQHGEILNSFKSGQFALRNLYDAQTVAMFLSSLFPRPEMAVSGLYELLLNGIEHGNLDIGFNEKTRLLEAGTWEQEVKTRLTLPENSRKKVKVEFATSPTRVDVTITDDGKGFDYRPYLEIEPSRATRANGRGIAKANLLSFDEMVFKGPGNQVLVSASF